MLFTTKTDKNVEIGRALAKFDTACRDLVNLVNDQLFETSRSPYWVADEVGGICDFGDTDFLSPIDMVVILDNNVTYEQYAEWRDANINNIERKGFINLESWIMGCRHDMLADKPTYPDHYKEEHQEQSKHNITMKFTKVIEGLQQGHNYTRSLWNGKKFITLQIPADISRDIIPKMTSLNDEAKELLLDHGDGMIHYRNQVLQVSLDNDDRQNIATYYIPTWEDIFADDWFWSDTKE